MTEYLIMFNDEWVPDLTLDDLRERGRAVQAVVEELEAAGALLYTHGGLARDTAIFSVAPDGDQPVFTDGPFAETKEHLGGFCAIEVPDDESARYWAGRIAVAVRWPQEVHRFPDRRKYQEAASAAAGAE